VAHPKAMRNSIYTGKETGVYVRNNGLGMFDGNDIYENTEAGVKVETGGDPTFKLNHIS
jgi:F-box protein 11